MGLIGIVMTHQYRLSLNNLIGSIDSYNIKKYK